MRENIFFHENNLKNKTETVRKNCKVNSKTQLGMK